jgi:hypothetical protein
MRAAGSFTELRLMPCRCSAGSRSGLKNDNQGEGYRSNKRPLNQPILQYADDLDDQLSKIVEHSFAKKFIRTDLSSGEAKRIEVRAKFSGTAICCLPRDAIDGRN